MLNQGCGYVQKGVVMLSMVWLCSKKCGYVVSQTVTKTSKNGVAGVVMLKKSTALAFYCYKSEH